MDHLQPVCPSWVVIRKWGLEPWMWSGKIFYGKTVIIIPWNSVVFYKSKHNNILFYIQTMTLDLHRIVNTYYSKVYQGRNKTLFHFSNMLHMLFQALARSWLSNHLHHWPTRYAEAKSGLLVVPAQLSPRDDLLFWWACTWSIAPENHIPPQSYSRGTEFMLNLTNYT